KNQYTQPLSALSEYTVPLWLPTNTRPPTTVGCAFASRSPGKPNAHFTLRRDACAAVMPALPESWKRVLLVLSPQPFQFFPVSGFAKPPGVFCAVTHIAPCGGSVDRSRADSDLPVTYCAIARRSAPLSRLAMEIIGPLSMAVSTRSAVIVCRASRAAAR